MATHKASEKAARYMCITVLSLVCVCVCVCVLCYSELGRVRALHVEQSSELEARVQRLRADKISGEQECEQQRASLRGVCVCVCWVPMVCVKPCSPAASQLEIKTLKDNMSSLLSQLDQERLAHKEAMSRLQGEAEEGGQQVAHLQQQLEGCKEELAQCLQRVEGEMERFRKEESEYKQQVRTTYCTILLIFPLPPPLL